MVVTINSNNMFAGVVHGIGDLPFIWGWNLMLENPEVGDDTGMSFARLIPWEDVDLQFSDFIHTVFSNFAKYGYSMDSLGLDWIFLAKLKSGYKCHKGFSFQTANFTNQQLKIFLIYS